MTKKVVLLALAVEEVLEQVLLQVGRRSPGLEQGPQLCLTWMHNALGGRPPSALLRRVASGYAPDHAGSTSNLPSAQNNTPTTPTACSQTS
mmetsp:Transcript_428/g.1136  ORF Transcript_428/g.1136 Transcript_428/m.1136 type:complete len:91 (+) Transcript_428:2382-2654(+)